MLTWLSENIANIVIVLVLVVVLTLVIYHRSRKNTPASSSGEMNSGEGTIVDYNHHYIKTFP